MNFFVHRFHPLAWDGRKTKAMLYLEARKGSMKGKLRSRLKVFSVKWSTERGTDLRK